jgi:hypothetical protein
MGSGCPRYGVRTRGLRSSIRNKGCVYVSCQTSVADLLASRVLSGYPTSRPSQYQLLDFWGRHAAPAASALSRKDATDESGDSWCVHVVNARVLHTQYWLGRYLELVRHLL